MTDSDLDAVYARWQDLLEVIANDGEVTPAVRALVAASTRIPEGLELLAEAGDKLTSRLEDPDGGSDPPEPSRELAALQELTMTAGLRHLGWSLLCDLAENTPSSVTLDRLSRRIDLGSEDPDELADLYEWRSQVHDTSGSLGPAAEDRIQAYQLATAEDAKYLHAMIVASFAHDAGNLDSAADWAWTAVGHAVSPDELDQDDLDSVVYSQVRALEQQHPVADFELPPRAVELILRLVEHPHWLDPELVTVTHTAAANIRVVASDLDGALIQLELAQRGWELAPDTVRTDWHLTRAEAAVIGSDARTVEESIRQASHYVRSAGDGEQHLRLRNLTVWLSGVYGRPVAWPEEENASGDVMQLAVRLAGGSATDEDVVLANAAVAHAEALGHYHSVAGAILMRAVAKAMTARPDGALLDLDAMTSVVEQHRDSGGFPWMSLLAAAESFRFTVMSTRDLDIEAAHALDARWREFRAEGRTVLAANAATVIGNLWVDLFHQPYLGVEAAVAALTMLQDLQASRWHSADRLARRGTLDGIVRARSVALSAVYATGDPTLMAELLEVLRAQDMPDAAEPVSSLSELAGSLLLPLLVEPDSSTEARSPGSGSTRMPPPPLVVMPWGGIALAPYLAYSTDMARAHATMRVGWPDIPEDSPDMAPDLSKT